MTAVPDIVTLATNPRVDPLVRMIWGVARLRGMTQADLARAAGINPSTLSLQLTGKNSPSVYVLRQLASAIGHNLTLAPNPAGRDQGDDQR